MSDDLLPYPPPPLLLAGPLKKITFFAASLRRLIFFHTLNILWKSQANMDMPYILETLALAKNEIGGNPAINNTPTLIWPCADSRSTPPDTTTPSPHPGAAYYTVSTKLKRHKYWAVHICSQTYTENHATFPIQIDEITVQICGNFWGSKYVQRENLIFNDLTSNKTCVLLFTHANNHRWLFRNTRARVKWSWEFDLLKALI